MLAFLLSRSFRDGSTGPSPESGVQKTVNTLEGLGPARPTEHDVQPEPDPKEMRTQGASCMAFADDAGGTTPMPDLSVSERPGANPLTVQLRLLDAYLSQVKDAEVPLKLAVGRTRR